MSFLTRKLPSLTSLSTIRAYSEVVNVFGRRNVETDKSLQERSAYGSIPEKIERVGELSGYPSEHINERKVRIYIPAKNAMQSGTYQTKRWRVEYDNRDRWENPNMGWGSSGDPMSPFTLHFTDKEDAIAYCQRMGFEYTVDEPQLIEKRIKSYGANFSWNKKTRRTTK